MADTIEEPRSMQNTVDGPTVFSYGSGQRDYILWQAKGDPNGEDIVEVPADVCRLPAFRKALKQGLFVEVTDQEQIDQADQAQREHWQATRDRVHKDSEPLERPEDNSYEALTCIGPADNGAQGKKCGAILTMKSEELKDKPPLCSRHKKLASNYIPTEIQDDEGNASVVWNPVTLSKRKTNA